jgi:hypothetical protein
VRGVAFTLACFALVAALLAWSRWLARRRAASLGHALMAIACAIVAALLWTAADGLANFEPLRPDMEIAQIRFDGTGSGHYRATLVRLPWGRAQVFEMDGERWRIEARTLRWQGLAVSLGLKSGYRLERLESGPVAGGTEGRSYALATDAGLDVWTRLRGNARWSRYAEAGVAEAPWEPMKDGAEFIVVATAQGLETRPVGAEVPVLAPARR